MNFFSRSLLKPETKPISLIDDKERVVKISELSDPKKLKTAFKMQFLSQLPSYPSNISKDSPNEQDLKTYELFSKGKTKKQNHHQPSKTRSSGSTPVSTRNSNKEVPGSLDIILKEIDKSSKKSVLLDLQLVDIKGIIENENNELSPTVSQKSSSPISSKRVLIINKPFTLNEVVLPKPEKGSMTQKPPTQDKQPLKHRSSISSVQLDSSPRKKRWYPQEKNSGPSPKRPISVNNSSYVQNKKRSSLSEIEIKNGKELIKQDYAKDESNDGKYSLLSMRKLAISTLNIELEGDGSFLIETPYENSFKDNKIQSLKYDFTMPNTARAVSCISSARASSRVHSRHILKKSPLMNAADFRNRVFKKTAGRINSARKSLGK